MQSRPQPGLDERHNVPGVPQHWTVQASRHVHWAKHAHIAAGTDTTNAHSAHSHASDALADALADNSVTDAVANYNE